MDNTVFLGELGLDGAVRHTVGVLAMVAMGKERNIKRVYVPAEDAPEAALLGGVDVLPVTTLRQLIMHLNGHPVAVGSIVPYIAEPPAVEESTAGQCGHGE